MDFKSMISRIESVDGPIVTPKAPVLPGPVKLDEDTEFRVLAGLQPLTESMLAEKKDSKADEEVKEDWPGTPEYKAKHGSDKERHAAKFGSDPELEKEYEEKKKKGGYGRLGPSGSESDEAAPKKSKKSKKDESLDPKFLEKFESMVEAKKKDIKGKKADEKMDEGSKPDFLDVDKDGDKKEPMKKATKDAKKGDDKKETKGLSAKQKKLPPGLQKAIAKKKSKTESARSTKRIVAESIEPTMSFKELMRLVVESGGQQQIDPMDKSLFAWATRVAENKLGEGTKAEVYAGLVYERMGGRFEMYDVLAESKKKVNEEADSRVAKLAKLTIQIMEKDGAKVGPNSDFHTIFDVLEQDFQGEKILRLVKQLDNEDFNTWERMIHDHFMPYEEIDEDWRKKLAAAGMAGVMGLGALSGAQAADMPDRDSASDRAVASQSDSVRLSDLEDQVKDLAKVDRKAAKSYEASKNLHDKWLMKSKSSEDMKRADKDFARSLQTIIKTSASIN